MKSTRNAKANMNDDVDASGQRWCQVITSELEIIFPNVVWEVTPKLSGTTYRCDEITGIPLTLNVSAVGLVKTPLDGVPKWTMGIDGSHLVHIDETGRRQYLKERCQKIADRAQATAQHD
jgi:hypothetical protein